MLKNFATGGDLPIPYSSYHLRKSLRAKAAASVPALAIPESSADFPNVSDERAFPFI
jgi:hypothetical protein